MNHLRFEDLPKAMGTVLKKLSLIEEELKAIKQNFSAQGTNRIIDTGRNSQIP